MSNHIKTERGQSLLELSLSLLLIFTLLAGAVDFGFAFFTYVQLRDAAQEGAVYASIDPANMVEIVDRVQTAGSSSIPAGGLHSPDVHVVIDFDGPQCEGTVVNVSVTYAHPIMMPFIGAFIGSQSIDLTASATDIVLQPPCP